MDTTKRLTTKIRDELKNGVGPYTMPRYKLVVQVVIGEIKGQGLRVMSKCLWDDQYDNFASYTYKNVKIETFRKINF